MAYRLWPRSPLRRGRAGSKLGQHADLSLRPGAESSLVPCSAYPHEPLGTNGHGDQPRTMGGPMALAHLDLEQLRSKVLAAYRADDPTLRRFREYARHLRADVRPLRTYAVNAVSFVSADGGDNRLRLDPAAVELVRVVDSRGNQCAMDAVPGTVTLEELEQRAVRGNPNVVMPLERLCRDLGKSHPGRWPVR